MVKPPEAKRKRFTDKFGFDWAKPCHVHMCQYGSTVYLLLHKQNISPLHLTVPNLTFNNAHLPSRLCVLAFQLLCLEIVEGFNILWSDGGHNDLFRATTRPAAPPRCQAILTLGPRHWRNHFHPNLQHFKYQLITTQVARQMLRPLRPLHTWTRIYSTQSEEVVNASLDFIKWKGMWDFDLLF